MELSLCVRHGAKKEQCSTKAVAYKPRSSEGCKTQARAGGVCWTHGTMKRKRCRIEGCTNISKKGGVCTRHGAKCSSEGCTNQSYRGGVCTRHGWGDALIMQQ
mmetsp:Transcript_29602/g.59488  ORF Transcript_29602/g.59488 Transcript_29602/m.59488 type:complete len:103 (-) Transcript_29602:133-441(-)